MREGELKNGTNEKGASLISRTSGHRYNGVGGEDKQARIIIKMSPIAFFKL